MWTYMDGKGEWVMTGSAQYDELQEKYRTGLEEFIESNQNEKDKILAGPRPILVRWFQDGVKYGGGLPTIIPDRNGKRTRFYQNPPDDLAESLNLAAGKLRCRILLWKRIELGYWPLIIFDLPPSPQWGLKARTSGRVIPLPYATVSESEGQEPGQRADYVLTVWYDLHCDLVYRFVSRSHERLLSDHKYRNIAVYEDLCHRQERIDRYLSRQGLDDIQSLVKRMTMETDEWGSGKGKDKVKGVFEYSEISAFLRDIGIKKSPEAVRKMLKNMG